MDDNRGSLLYVTLACIVAALGGLMFGFDTGVVSGVNDLLKLKWPLLTDWMSGLIVASAPIGCLLGAAVAGTLSDRFGRKKILILAALLFVLCAIGSAAPRAPWHLVAARLVGGTGIGITSMLSPMYIAEIAPARLRGGLIAVCQLAITIGILAAYFSNYVLAEIAHRSPEFYGTGLWRMMFVDEVWRGMLLVGLLPSAILFVLLWFVPESPRWLTKQARSAAALDILTRVNGRAAAARELAEIEETIAQESGSIRQLFHHKMRLALLIGITLPFFSQISGINVIMYYGPTVLKDAGLAQNAALYWQILFGTMATLATVAAMLTIDKLGRKAPLLTGIAGVGLMLALSGALLAAQHVSPVLLIVVFAVYVACFNFSYGPICWVIVSEIFPTAIRGRAMSISIFSLWLGCSLVTLTFPGLWRSLGHTNTFWLYALTTPPAFLLVLFLVPETKGKSLEQIERYWGH